MSTPPQYQPNQPNRQYAPNQQSPFPQQPSAYSQPPYGQAYAPPQPAAPFAPQAPYGQQPSPYGHVPRRVPGPAGEGRRWLAVTLDLVVAVGGPYLLARGEEGRPLIALAVLLGASFVNQVLLTVLFRASVGKLIAGVRVIRAADGGRPGFWRAVYRWLCGLCWLPLQPYYWLRAFFRGLGGGGSARGTVADNDDGELYHADLAGLRYARRTDLAA
ncbi:RDD family protein [Streptomyces sp. NPDC046712]|uniref:RDD family protein n=1 Tax=Streptomyces sp. NPDC046712 TaxID=3154802 RepID=UPI0033CBC6EB